MSYILKTSEGNIEVKTAKDFLYIIKNDIDKYDYRYDLYKNLKLSNINDKDLKTLLVMNLILADSDYGECFVSWIEDNLQEIYDLGFKEITDSWLSLYKQEN